MIFKTRWMFATVMLCCVIPKRSEAKMSEEEDEYENELKRIIFTSSHSLLPKVNTIHKGIKVVKQLNTSIARKLNNIRSMDDFAELFGVESVEEDENELSSRIAPSESTEIANAGCTPLLTPVPISVPSDQVYASYPSCVLLERCGGCCYGTRLSCQPKSTEQVKIQVMLIPSESRTAEPLPESVTVEEERHLKCSCQCIVKKEDCKAEIQIYNEKECTCECADRQIELGCGKKHKTHFWDRNQCKCFCKDVLECSSGLQFDHQDCRCKGFVNSLDRSLNFNLINATDAKSINIFDTAVAGIPQALRKIKEKKIDKKEVKRIEEK